VKQGISTSFNIYVGNNEHHSFTTESVGEFRRMTQRAANQKKENFVFEGKSFITEYAQYLVPILSSKKNAILNK
jgi:hypothetical protein